MAENISSNTINETITWQYPKPFIHKIKVLPQHTDRLGHTNNTCYLQWLEEIAWAHMEHLKYGWSIMESSTYALAIIHTELNYLQASYANETLQLATWITSNDERFKCGREFQIVRPTDSKVILSAKMVFACISLKSGRPAKMPSSMIEALNLGLIER